MDQVRQGDLLFLRRPRAANLGWARDNVLARGEQTGHSHVAKNAGVFDLRPLQGVIRMVVRARAGGATVEHQEHAMVTLPEGDWEVRRQREWAPKEPRTVVD